MTGEREMVTQAEAHTALDSLIFEQCKTVDDMTTIRQFIAQRPDSPPAPAEGMSERRFVQLAENGTDRGLGVKEGMELIAEIRRLRAELVEEHKATDEAWQAHAMAVEDAKAAELAKTKEQPVAGEPDITLPGIPGGPFGYEQPVAGAEEALKALNMLRAIAWFPVNQAHIKKRDEAFAAIEAALRAHATPAAQEGVLVEVLPVEGGSFVVKGLWGQPSATVYLHNELLASLGITEPGTYLLTRATRVPNPVPEPVTLEEANADITTLWQFIEAEASDPEEFRPLIIRLRRALTEAYAKIEGKEQG